MKSALLIVAVTAAALTYRTAEVASAGDVPYPITSVAEGVVVLDVSIGHNGAVTGTNALRDVPSLTDVAAKSVQSWKFRPAAAPSAMTVAIAFRPPVAMAAPPSFAAAQPAEVSGYKPAGISAVAYPDYPINSIASGAVVLQVVVDASGRAGAVEVVRGIGSLTEPAISAARKWRFQAATWNHKPVRSKVAIAFVFRPPTPNP